MKGVVFCFLVLSISVTAQKEMVVAKDGSGDYTSVQDALDAIPVGNEKERIIRIKNGVYKERLVLDSLKNYVTLIGQDKDRTILTYDNHTGRILPNGDTVNTWTSASFFLLANHFKARNITFENNAGFTAGQAVAVFAKGDQLSFINCRFVGFQDVLFCSGAGSRHYYKNCYIEGTTDFIFGSSTAVFQDCVIHSKKNSHITAASTPQESKYGFVFIHCKLTADSAVNKVTLGRPWRPYASVAYIKCTMGNHIIPEGWDNWRNVANEKTARYSEYKSAGTHPASRVKWSRQLTDKEAAKYSLKTIFGDWNPEQE
jgi:pectinesterase